jgi:TnpA family transposase
LRYFRDRYVTTTSVRMAIAALVNRILAIRNPRIWGQGTSCASDGKQLGAWDQNLVAQWHPRYRKQGVMAYWHVDKNSTCIFSQVKRPLSSEVAAMLEGLVRHDTEMRVERNFVDTHGQSEVAFAFTYLLGIALMPRLRRIKHERLYLPDKGMVDRFPNLKSVLVRPIRWERIAQQYDEMIRHVVAVQEGTAPIDSILRRFNRYNQSHPTYKAFIELGKALKTTFLCQYLESEKLRQEINEGLNVVENWNSIIDFIFFGRKSEIGTNDLVQQELAVLCLHLLQNTVILVNTVMLERILDENGLDLSAEDQRAITPLFTLNLNPYGDFNLDLVKPSFLREAA